MKDKHHSSVHAALYTLFVTVSFLLSTPVRGQAPPGALWYNGDFNTRNGLANEDNTLQGVGQYARVYDNFLVTDPAGWMVGGVFSNNLLNTNVTGATWEIRSGTTLLNTGGVLVAGGTTATPVVTATGRSAFGFTEFRIEVTGLNLLLPALASGQFYWLNVTPIGDGTGRSFNSQTDGANALGSPPGNDLNAFFDSNIFGANFASTADFDQPADFSMGVIGIVVPEPGTWALLSCGVGALLVAARRRRAN